MILVARSTCWATSPGHFAIMVFIAFLPLGLLVQDIRALVASTVSGWFSSWAIPRSSRPGWPSWRPAPAAARLQGFADIGGGQAITAMRPRCSPKEARMFTMHLAGFGIICTRGSMLPPSAKKDLKRTLVRIGGSTSSKTSGP
jgi:hypothetical protein